MGSSSHVDDSITRKYDIKRRLGKGAYGIVWKAVDRSTNRLVAVKKIFDAFCNQTDAQRTFREIVFLQEFRDHPNIVKLLNIHRASNDKDIYLIFEYMETDLHKVIKRKHILQDLHKRYIMYQLLRATYYIHSGNVIHRDQKPSNILLDSYCRCKVADFGLARSLSLSHPDSVEGVSGTDPALTDYVATRWYRAPEILVASRQYTKGIDMWSLGCILAEMLLGKPLFPGSSTINQVEKIMATMEPPTPSDLACVCPGYGSSLFQRVPAGPRVPLPELLRGAPQDGVDLVCRLLVLNPLRRLTAEQALEHPYVARFRRQGPEPALQRPVIPKLRDDVQLSVHEYRSKLYEMYDGDPASPCSSSSSSSSGCSSGSGSSAAKHKAALQGRVQRAVKPVRSLAAQGGGDAGAPVRVKKAAVTSCSSSGSGSSGGSATLRAPASPVAREPLERRQVQVRQPHSHHHLLPKRMSVSDSAVAHGRDSRDSRHRPPAPQPARRPHVGPSQVLGGRRSYHAHLDRLEEPAYRAARPKAPVPAPPRARLMAPAAAPEMHPQLVSPPPAPPHPLCPLAAHAPAAARRYRVALCPPPPPPPASHGPRLPGQSCSSSYLGRPAVPPPPARTGLLGAHTVGNVGIISASGLSELRPGYRWRR